MAIPTRTNQLISTIGNAAMITGGGTNYLVETQTGVVYCVFIDVNNDPAFSKSLDYGKTWGAATVLKNCSCTQISIWFDLWTDPTGSLGYKIHVVYTDALVDDVFYRNVDTANADTLGTERTVFAGSSTAAGGAISISRMRGGNLICIGCIDAGTEIFTRKSTDIGVNWTDAAAGYEANADLCIMLPDPTSADANDGICIYYDRSATEVSRKIFDDSANSWAESSIATSIVLPDHTSTTLGHISAAMDWVNSQIITVFWNSVDLANADLLCFAVTNSAITAKTDVVTNSTDDQGFCVISIFGSVWYVAYCGNSDGSENFFGGINLYYKTSSDGGVNWSNEIRLSSIFNTIPHIFGLSIMYKTFNVAYIYTNVTPSYVAVNTNYAIPRTTFQLGM